MKKFINAILIVLASVIVLCAIAIGIASWVIFTPEKLTPIVNKQMEKLLSSETKVSSVELQVFHNFPNVELKLSGFSILNPIPDAPNDTLLYCAKIWAQIDVKSVMNDGPIAVKGVRLENGTINIFVDSLGNTNYDIFASDTTTLDKSEENSEILPEIILDNISCSNINFAYIDKTLPLNTTVKDLEASLVGNLKNNILWCDVEADNGVLSIVYDGEPYLREDTLKVSSIFSYYLDYLRMDIDTAVGIVNNIPISAYGMFEEDTISKDLIFDLYYQSNNASVAELIPMIPPSYQEYTEGITATGKANIDGSMIGRMGDDKMPMFVNTIQLTNGTASYEGVPIPITNIQGKAVIVTDAINDDVTYMTLENITANAHNSTFAINGKLDQLFSDIACDIQANFDLKLDEFNSLIPSEYLAKIKGNAQGNIATKLTLTQIENESYEKIKANGRITLSDFSATYDTLWANTPYTIVDLKLPGSATNKKFVEANIITNTLNAGVRENYLAQLGNSIIRLNSSNPLDTTKLPEVSGTFTTNMLSVKMDTISTEVAAIQTNFSLKPSNKKASDPHVRLNLKTGTSKFEAGNEKASMDQLHFIADLENDSEQSELALQWKVNGLLDFQNGHISTSMMAYPVEIPSIKMNITPDSLNIEESNLVIHNSDFGLKGTLTNIYNYLRGDSLLKGDFNFTSDQTDISELMALTSGIGYKETEPIDTTRLEESTMSAYMVPKNVDIKLSTNIKTAKYSITAIRDITGDVRIHNGTLILDELRLNTPASKVQVTALYRTPRKNHLFTALDLKLQEIEIDEIRNTIPDLDSIMPMLKSFKGTGEFHMGIQTSLDSLYNPKMSTLLGAASITGNDLVLMDGETFTEIAKTLRFSKKAENKVDSLSAEFTIFRNEIDVYPFLIVMDKYKAVVAGRHNLDLSFNYDITLLESPLPIKIGVNVSGNLEDLHYKRTLNNYAEGYRPSARYAVQNRQLKLRELIKEDLINNVKRGN